MFGIRKFYHYIFGRKFTIQYDSKILKQILDENQEIPKHTGSCLAHYAIILSSYNYKIMHRPGKENVAADALSRLPMNKEEDDTFNKEDSYLIFNMKIEDLELTKKNLRKKIWNDTDLAEVIRYLHFGWPDKRKLNKNLHTYFEKRDELALIDDILIWRDRLIIPEVLRKPILNFLHRSHPGIIQTQSLAKTYVYWSRINNDIEEMINKCESCQRYRNKEPETPLNSWNVPQRPWQRLHVHKKYREFKRKEKVWIKRGENDL